MAIRFARGAATLAALLVSTHLHAQLATGEFERTLSVDEPVTLDVVTGSGSIDIRQGPPGEVRIHGRISVGRSFLRDEAEAEALVDRIEADPPIAVSGSRIDVGRIDDEELRRSVSISYDIVVPAETSATSRTGSGSQTLTGLSGSVSAATGSGDVNVDGIGGEVTLRTGSGSIVARGIDAPFTARTGSGSIRLSDSRATGVDVATGSGSIELAGVEGELSARAGSGDITAEGTPTGPWHVQSGSGSIAVRLPPGAEFDVDAHTGSGRISVEQQISVSGEQRRNSLSGRVGGGGPMLSLRTGSGSVRIEER